MRRGVQNAIEQEDGWYEHHRPPEMDKDDGFAVKYWKKVLCWDGLMVELWVTES